MSEPEAVRAEVRLVSGEMLRSKWLKGDEAAPMIDFANRISEISWLGIPELGGDVVAVKGDQIAYIRIIERVRQGDNGDG
ncbi:hypothetical protein [Brevibacterium gallinarum]|uniref:Uncharacterized protein n=1 Tax=Brevibacterium gallinarum TaxID=2762220 RepID=A0ABR8WRP5_9MICO|nr:hypothetical protein [Brevibacterium gallinarum]MBD8019371.1 hypothetical protein [Brevibacterium gallinarum]